MHMMNLIRTLYQVDGFRPAQDNTVENIDKLSLKVTESTSKRFMIKE